MLLVCVDYFSIKETGIIGHTIQDLMEGVNMTDLMTGINITNITYQWSDQWSELSTTLADYTTGEEEAKSTDTTTKDAWKERSPTKEDLTKNTQTVLRLNPTKLNGIIQNQTSSSSQRTETATSEEVPQEPSSSSENNKNKPLRRERRKKKKQPSNAEESKVHEEDTAAVTTNTKAEIQPTTTAAGSSPQSSGSAAGNMLQPYPTSYKKPYFKKAGVHVIQIADAQYAERMHAQVERNREWVNCTGYTYRLETFPKSSLSAKQLRNRGKSQACPFTIKVQKIYELLLKIPLGDWLIFLDIDVQYQGTTCDAMERMLPQQSQRDSQNCEVVIHSSGQTINTAIVVLQATTATRQLLQDWYEFQAAHPVCDGCADQYALQEVIMRTYVPDYQEKASPCWSKGPKNKNICFSRNFPSHKRSVGNLCLMPCTKDQVTLQCRDCWDEPCDVDKAIFWHNRGARKDLLPLNQSTYYTRELR